MTPATLLALADRLALGADETDWRSAISRGYYAAFHASREFMRRRGFLAPRADGSHAYLERRLNGGGEAAVVHAGRLLGKLRAERNKADYDLAAVFDQALAAKLVADARTIIATLAAVEADPPRLAAVVAAIRAHALNILKEQP